VEPLTDGYFSNLRWGCSIIQFGEKTTGSVYDRVNNHIVSKHVEAFVQKSASKSCGLSSFSLLHVPFRQRYSGKVMHYTRCAEDLSLEDVIWSPYWSRLRMVSPGLQERCWFTQFTHDESWIIKEIIPKLALIQVSEILSFTQII